MLQEVSDHVAAFASCGCGRVSYDGMTKLLPNRSVRTIGVCVCAVFSVASRRVSALALFGVGNDRARR